MALTQALTIGIDIGGTKVAAGVVDPEGNILDRVRRDTPTKDPQRPRTRSPRSSTTWSRGTT